MADLPPRFTASDRLKDFATERGRELLERFSGPEDRRAARSLGAAFGDLVGGEVSQIDRTDGLRVSFSNGEIVHLRPSGNAPEFRCYTEASTAGRATELCRNVLERLRGAPSP